MDLHICAINIIFMYDKLVVCLARRNRVHKKTLQSTRYGGYFNIWTVLGIGIQWDSPLNTFPISPINIICLLGMREKNDERKCEFCEEVIRKEQTEFLFERINQYNNLARTAKELESIWGEVR